MFHDAKGFQIASTEVGDAVESFLEDAHNSASPEQQIHAVWCVLTTRKNFHLLCILNILPGSASLLLRQGLFLMVYSRSYEVPGL